MAEEIERIERELVYTGTIVKFYKDHIKMPDGKMVHWDFIEHVGAAAVIPVTDDGKILMVRQYRNALDRYTLEIPAGALDSREEPTRDCAGRELEEETGYSSDDLEFLITINTTVAFCNELIDIYVARNLKKTQQRLDEDEFIDVEAWELSDLCEKIYRGELRDSKTVAALLAYACKRNRQLD